MHNSDSIHYHLPPTILQLRPCPAIFSKTSRDEYDVVVIGAGLAG